MQAQLSPLWLDEVGQIEASGHQLLLDPRESSKGDLNFKKVAGVDNGADLFIEDPVVE